jgi:hypothetical protein
VGESRLRIPVVTAASLVLGASAGACGDDDDSKSRQQAIAAKVCKQGIMCSLESGSQELCESSYAQSFAEAKKNLSDECFDLYLDYLDCYGDLSCEELETGPGCEKEFAKLEEQCEAFRPEEYEE